MMRIDIEAPGSENNHDGRPPEPIESIQRREEPAPLIWLWDVVAESAGSIILITIGAALGAFLLARFYMTPLYRGEALLRPSGVTAGPGLAAMGAIAGAESASGVMELMAAYQAEEYLAILRSYSFADSIVCEFKLSPFFLDGQERQRLDRVPLHNRDFARSWLCYTVLRSHFDCEYDRLTNNLVLHFVNRDRAVAQRVLDAYIKGLREKLRNRAVQDAAGASESLIESAQHTSDSMLQKELYDVIARQIERQKLAQVQADFAFTVIEPPVVPVERYRPIPMLDAALAAMTTLMLLFVFLLVRELMKAGGRRSIIWPHR